MSDINSKKQIVGKRWILLANYPATTGAKNSNIPRAKNIINVINIQIFKNTGCTTKLIICKYKTLLTNLVSKEHRITNI